MARIDGCDGPGRSCGPTWIVPFSLTEIAAEADLSRYHFLRVFRLRIERGQQELVRTTASVSEIALHCGFSTSASFATAFRRRTGYAPTAWRGRFGRQAA